MLDFFVLKQVKDGDSNNMSNELPIEALKVWGFLHWIF